MAVRIVFKCGNPKCHASVDADLLNRVKLKIIRRVAVLCKRCNTRTIWSETSMLIDVEQQQKTKEMEGRDAHTTNNTH
jgi:hypothetical protein